MVAQRAARGLGSLYAHANEMTMEEAGKIHSEWTPRGWMKTERELLIFEQHLYARQPGYGTSYIVGKYLLEETMAAYARQKENQGEPFKLKDTMIKIEPVHFSEENIPIYFLFKGPGAGVNFMQSLSNFLERLISPGKGLLGIVGCALEYWGSFKLPPFFKQDDQSFIVVRGWDIGICKHVRCKKNDNKIESECFEIFYSHFSCLLFFIKHFLSITLKLSGRRYRRSARTHG